MLKNINIEKFGGDWYCFESVPQEGRYIKVANLRQSSDRKAINTAKKLNPNFNYNIVIKAEKD